MRRMFAVMKERKRKEKEYEKHSSRKKGKIFKLDCQIELPYLLGNLCKWANVFSCVCVCLCK